MSENNKETKEYWQKVAQDKENEVNLLKQIIEEERKTLKAKDNEIQKLRNEIHKCKSVLAAKYQTEKPDLLASIHELPGLDGTERSKKQGVSGESSQQNVTTPDLFKHVEKDFK